jgi:uncharacterized protein (TIGR03435 family)
MPRFSIGHQLRRATLSAATGLVVLLPTLACGQASVTDPTYVPSMTFDIASIRQTGGIADHGLRVGVKNPTHASTFEATNFTVKSLIQLAYGFDTPISGGPDWLGDRYFNVQAKSDPAADAKLAKLSDDDAKLEKRHMLQALLADRMGLKTHLETRETSVYALVVAKNGPKLQEPKPEASDAANPDQPKPAAPGADVRALGTPQGLEFTVQNATTKSIAAILVSQVETPIIDRTGLTGTYKFVLQFGRDWSAANPDGWPTIFTALQEQLGLKLDPIKASVPVLVIDHIELPSAN